MYSYISIQLYSLYVVQLHPFSNVHCKVTSVFNCIQVVHCTVTSIFNCTGCTLYSYISIQLYRLDLVQLHQYSIVHVLHCAVTSLINHWSIVQTIFSFRFSPTQFYLRFCLTNARLFLGRLFYGFIMDKTAYKVAMCVEASLLILLMSTFYLTSLIGNLNVETSESLKNSLKTF